MSEIIGSLVKAVALLAGVPAAGLFAYDMAAVRPHLGQIEEVLAKANPGDASPPSIIRDLIDANAGSPASHSTRLVTSLVYDDLSQGQWQWQWHVRNALWRILLPFHFDEPQLYGLYSVLSYNGTDHGLSSFARREYQKSLHQLSPTQAATTVAITHAPTTYLRNRDRLNKRANLLLEKSRHAP